VVSIKDFKDLNALYKIYETRKKYLHIYKLLLEKSSHHKSTEGKVSLVFPDVFEELSEDKEPYEIRIYCYLFDLGSGGRREVLKAKDLQTLARKFEKAVNNAIDEVWGTC